MVHPHRSVVGFFPTGSSQRPRRPRHRRREIPTKDPTALEPSIYRFILRFSLRQQIFLLFLTLASFPFLYYQLQLPKIITNKAIKPKYVPQTYFGIQFDQIRYLLVLCVAFLVVVLINGGV